MKTQDQVIESIGRFRESFWDRKSTSRPPVGIYDENTSLPINFLRQPFTRPTVRPEDLSGDFVATEYEYSFGKRSVIADDFMAFAAPWRGIPWLEAVCGCQVRYSEGSLAPAHFVESLDALEQIPIPAVNGWLGPHRQIPLRGLRVRLHSCLRARIKVEIGMWSCTDLTACYLLLFALPRRWRSSNSRGRWGWKRPARRLPLLHRDQRSDRACSAHL